DPQRALDVRDRAVTIAQVDEPLGLLREPVPDRDRLVGSELERPWPHELPAEPCVAPGQRPPAHHDVEQHTGGERHGDHRRRTLCSLAPCCDKGWVKLRQNERGERLQRPLAPRRSWSWGPE